MNSISHGSVEIQTSPVSLPAIPDWFGEVIPVVQYLKQLGVLSAISQRVRLARGRMGTYEVIDFVAVLIGYALSGERTLQAFYERLVPFATPLMALFGRKLLPHRSSLSRFLAHLAQPTVEVLRTLFLEDLGARSLSADAQRGLWDRCGEPWQVFDVDGTRAVARQRALAQSGELPAPQRRLQQVSAPGYRGHKRGEVVRTRTVVQEASTHRFLGTFGGAGNGDYRGELARALGTLTTVLAAPPQPRVIVRLDGLYGDGVVIGEHLRKRHCGRGDLEVANKSELRTTHISPSFKFNRSYYCIYYLTQVKLVKWVSKPLFCARNVSHVRLGERVENGGFRQYRREIISG